MAIVLYRNNCEGASNGTAITTANSDDNSAGDAFTVVANTTKTFDTSTSMHGATSLKFVAAATNPLVGYNTGLSTKGSTRFYFRFTANPGATLSIFQVRGGGAGAASINLLTNGKLRVDDKLAAYNSTTTTTLSINTWYRIEFMANSGTTTGDGSLSFKLFSGDSTTALDTITTTTANVGAGAVLNDWRYGIPLSGTGTTYVDDIAYADDSTAYLGPLAGDGLIATSETDSHIIDVTGSNGTLTMAQTGGTACTYNSSPVSNKFTIVVPAHSDVLTFVITAVGDTTVTKTITINPISLSNELVFQGGDSTDIDNWE